MVWRNSTPSKWIVSKAVTLQFVEQIEGMMHVGNKLSLVLTLMVVGLVTGTANHASATSSGEPFQDDALAGRIFEQEAKLAEALRSYSPLVETYIQNLKFDKDLGNVPASDKYFIGRLLANGKDLQRQSFDKQDKKGLMSRVVDRMGSVYRMNYLPQGFMQLLVLNHRFDKENYQLKLQRQQFLGEVRTLVFDVQPQPRVKGPHFVGRIWVEDQDYNIVRINGRYAPDSGSRYNFHFDSWRLNMQPGLWLPAYVYTEESDAKYALVRNLTMKGQTRLWDYDRKRFGLQTEFTGMQVEPLTGRVSDQSGVSGNQISPRRSEYLLEREAEDNVLDRMERAGLLAPPGEVSKVLQAVINNLEITNNLNIDPEVRCRVLLTTPLESFTVGNTIVVSRGLLDVLPDEPSLAMVMAHELGHIALGHRMNTKYAFTDRLIFPDENIFAQIGMAQNERDEAAADQRGLEFLQKSPYKDKLASAGLFLRAVEAHSRSLSWLINPHFGDKLAKGSSITRMPELARSAPELAEKDINQIAALPLGNRIKLDPWDDHLEMQQDKTPLRSARDKMPFEVAPMFPELTRFKGGDSGVTKEPK